MDLDQGSLPGELLLLPGGDHELQDFELRGLVHCRAAGYHLDAAVLGEGVGETTCQFVDSWAREDLLQPCSSPIMQGCDCITPAIQFSCDEVEERAFATVVSLQLEMHLRVQKPLGLPLGTGPAARTRILGECQID